MARKMSSSVKKGLKLKVRESHVFRVCRSYLGKTERERRSLHVQVNKERVRMMWEVRLPFSAWCSLDLLVETRS